MKGNQSDEDDDSPISSLASSGGELMGTEEMIDTLREMNDEGSQETTDKSSEEERSCESIQHDMTRVGVGVEALDISEERGNFSSNDSFEETKAAEDILLNAEGLSIEEREVHMAGDQLTSTRSEDSKIDSDGKKRGFIRRRWIKLLRAIGQLRPFRKGDPKPKDDEDDRPHGQGDSMVA